MEINHKLQTLIDKIRLNDFIDSESLNETIKQSTSVTYSKKENIFKKGEFVTHLPLLVDGCIKIEIEETKRKFIIDIINSPSFIGLPLILSVEKHVFSAVTLSEAEIVFIPMGCIKSVLNSNSVASQALIDYGNRNFVIHLLDKLHSSTQNNVRGRLAKLLLHLSINTYKCKNFVLDINRNEIAQMIGFSRENVIRILTEFNSEGIIKLNGKTIEVVDIDKLEGLARYS